MKDSLRSGECAERLKPLGDRDRLKIIQCLHGGPKTVSDLAEQLDTPLANVSHHDLILHHAGVVQYEKQGRNVVYSLRPDVFRPKNSRQPTDLIDFGCCRLQLGRASNPGRRTDPNMRLD